MKTKIFFSIVIPVFNVEKYLEECIESVLNQTFKDYEIILVDDGSTDSSGEICNEYAERFPSIIKTIHKMNEGQFSARYVGIKESSGRYIVPLDSDDALKNDALHILYESIQKSDPDIVMFNGSRDNSFIEPFYNYGFEDYYVFSEENKKILYQKLLRDNSLNSFCMKTYRKSLLLADVSNMEKIKSIRNGEDMMQLLPIITAADSILFINEKLYYYRINPTSVTRKYNSSFYESRKIIFEELKTYIDIWKIPRSQGMKLLVTKTLDNIYYVIKDLKYAESEVIRRDLFKISRDPWFCYIYDNADKTKIRFKEIIILRLLKYRMLFILYLCLKLF